MAHSPQGQVTEQELPNNDSGRIVLLTYPPGAEEALRPASAHWLPEASAHLAGNERKRPAEFWSILLKRCE